MAERELPAWRNPMLTEEYSPAHEILVERRCLGQTELKVKPGQIGTSNATKPDNLGVLDYAHLRVPLPKDLSTSGIFAKGSNRKYPEAYFLMRRSTDGYISATGMFKAAYPYAQVEEEATEKDYIKSLPTTSTEEVAGNVWIHPDQALSLADEYGIKLWIAALLDPQPITHGISDPSKHIKSPPTFRIKDMVNGLGRTPEKKTPGSKRGAGSMRARRASTRSVSPSKSATSERPKATPGKKRGRKALTAIDESAAHDDDTVKVEVETRYQPTANGDEEVERTKVNIEMPKGHGDLELPGNAEDMLKQARQMVEEASKAGSPTKKSKRKAEEMVEEGDEVGLDGPVNAAKRPRQTEIELRKERIRRRAFTGMVATVAVGALVPILATFPW